MLLKKLRELIKENKAQHKRNFLQAKELEWAHVYHDSIRGIQWLEKISLNIGRWAGSYSFFYVLHRVLKDGKPKKILEFGLGESTKLVSAYLKNYLLESDHLVIEQDTEWYDFFQKSNVIDKRIKIEICPLEKRNINDYEVNCYKGLSEIAIEDYDLYIVDGPLGSSHFSRYDIVEVLKAKNKDDEFVVLIDDYNRVGEKETVNELLKMFKLKGIEIYKGIFEGSKSVCLLATKKYKFLKSI